MVRCRKAWVVCLPAYFPPEWLTVPPPLGSGPPETTESGPLSVGICGRIQIGISVGIGVEIAWNRRRFLFFNFDKTVNVPLFWCFLAQWVDWPVPHAVMLTRLSLAPACFNYFSRKIAAPLKEEIMQRTFKKFSCTLSFLAIHKQITLWSLDRFLRCPPNGIWIIFLSSFLGDPKQFLGLFPLPGQDHAQWRGFRAPFACCCLVASVLVFLMNLTHQFNSQQVTTDNNLPWKTKRGSEFRPRHSWR